MPRDSYERPNVHRSSSSKSSIFDDVVDVLHAASDKLSKLGNTTFLPPLDDFLGNRRPEEYQDKPGRKIKPSDGRSSGSRRSGQKGPSSHEKASRDSRTDRETAENTQWNSRRHGGRNEPLPRSSKYTTGPSPCDEEGEWKDYGNWEDTASRDPQTQTQYYGYQTSEWPEDGNQSSQPQLTYTAQSQRPSWSGYEDDDGGDEDLFPVNPSRR